MNDRNSSSVSWVTMPRHQHGGGHGVRTTAQRRGLRAALATVVAPVLLAGCLGKADVGNVLTGEEEQPAQLVITPADNATGIRPDEPVTVHAVDGGQLE